MSTQSPKLLNRKIVKGKRGTRPLRVLEAGLRQIALDAANGLSVGSIASRLGISRRVFYKLRQTQVEVADALEEGHSKLEDEIVDLLLSQGRKGSTTALIWLSKNRLGWRDKPADEQQTVAVQINLPRAMSETDYRQAIDVGSKGVE